MNATILTQQVDPPLSGAPVVRVKPARDEYAGFCNYCGLYFIEKKIRGRHFQYCLVHRSASQRTARSVAKRSGKIYVAKPRRLLKKSNTTVVTHANDCLLAPVGTIAIKRICVNPNCGKGFIARHEAAIYCDLDCYAQTRHHKRAA